MTIAEIRRWLGAFCVGGALVLAPGCSEPPVPGEDEIEKLSPEYDPSDNPNMGEGKAVGDP